jgi:putative ABC transport system permease protein
MMLAMSIGVAAVVLLTALGDGARRYVVGEFSALGANLVIVLPGRAETRGFNLANLVTETPRDLTVEDAAALIRLPDVRRVAPLTLGTSEAAYGGRLRQVTVVGTGSDYADIRGFRLAQGRFLRLPDLATGAAEAVIGADLRKELFGPDSAVGRMLRVGDRRFRVVGVLAPTGQGLGMNTDELVFLPTPTAQAMFNTGTLFRIIVEARHHSRIDAAKAQVKAQLIARHDGEEDITVITQDAVLATFDRILTALTLAIAGIAAVSLAVAGILVMNVMLVAVTQRTGEIGLMKALGAPPATIRHAFLAEAALLSVAGAALGVALGHLGAFGLRAAFPALPAYPPDWAVIAGVATALITGVLFGALPARRAARLNAVDALAKR